MPIDPKRLTLHELSLVLYGLPSTATVRLDLPIASGASIAMLPWIPAVQLGASQGVGFMTLRNFRLQPRRLQFEVEGAPAELPLTLQVSSAQPYLFGWLQVPDQVQSSIATALQRMRVVGATYWALPVVTAETADAKATDAPAAAAVPVATSAASPSPSRGRRQDAGPPTADSGDR
ncbi:MAG TPA: hypothetical protein VF619_07875 [Allosphingosinicella sp.]|jgi:hypothetical protein